MKKVLILLCCALVINTAKGQDFEKGGNYITLGYGLDPWGNPYNGTTGFLTGSTYTKSTIGPIMLTYERGVTDILGIGRIGAGGAIVQTFYNQTQQSGAYKWTYNRSRIGIIARATYHFEFDIPKMDVYAGVGGGVYINTDKDKVPSTFDPNNHTVTRSTSTSGGHYIFAGIRYYFTDAFGVYAEAGHGVSALNGGLTFKF